MTQPMVIVMLFVREILELKICKRGNTGVCRGSEAWQSSTFAAKGSVLTNDGRLFGLGHWESLLIVVAMIDAFLIFVLVIHVRRLPTLPSDMIYSKEQGRFIGDDKA